MKLNSILSLLAVCASLASQAAYAVNCQPNRLPSNPNTAYTLPVKDNGTVTHAPTGLTWKRCSEGQTWIGGTCTGTVAEYDWPGALAAARHSDFAGSKDWRVPNIKELRSLVEECRYFPAINDTIFPGTPDDSFWSSSPKDSLSDKRWSWTVNARAGLNAAVPREFGMAVRLVRGGDYFDNQANPDSAAANTALLSVSASGSGGVSTDAAAGGVSCTSSTLGNLSGVCSAILPINSSVTLTAIPASGGTFTGWSGVCSGIDSNCSVSMTAAKAVTARFSGGTPPAATVPGAPIGLTATPGDANASLVFTAPLSNGGATINAYTASCSATGQPQTKTAASPPITVGSLNNGTTYICTVWATNSAGEGHKASVDVTPVASTAVPGDLTRLIATPGNASATLSFAAPSTGGSVASYSASCTAPGAKTQTPTPVLVSPIVVTGLTNGTAYSCAVWASNSNGSGLASSVPVTPAANAAQTGCYPLSKISESFSMAAHIGEVTITSGTFNESGGVCRFPNVSSSSKSPWIKVVGALTVDPVTIDKWTAKYSVDVNDTGLTRTGALIFTDPSNSANSRTYPITQWGPDGMPAPTCTLTASSASIYSGSSSTLTASCTPTATSYVWTGDNCAGTTAASCTVKPTESTTTYTVAGINSVGTTGAAASASVSVATIIGLEAGTPITRYRLYNDSTKEHLYTTDLNEYNVLSTGGSWLGEGPIYMLFQGPGTLSNVDAVPYYRLYNPASFQHHWTTDANEYAVLATKGWTQEVIDGYIMPTEVPGTLPLYRLYLNAFGGLHLWTMDANERTVLTTTSGWVDEGIAGYVIPMP